MKTRKFFGILMILASGFLFVNCTSDPIPGPPGKDGVDGADGVDGQDGVSGTASCVSCHSNANREPILLAFEASLHNAGETWEERGFYNGTTACSQCHSGPGYTEFIETGSITPSEDLAAPLSCNACHDMHETFDFDTDGQDYALRNTEGTFLDLAPNVFLDFEGTSNNCITCHQPRPADIPTLSDGTFTITSPRYGPHHSPQSTMLEGILGAEIPGDEAYPAAGSARHRLSASCVECHMGESEDPDVGGHSWTYVTDGCINCHGEIPETTGYKDDIPRLFALLQQVEGVDADGNPIVGMIDSRELAVQGIWPDVAAMAFWNYKYITEDQSEGVHNPNYTKALLQNSIQAVEELVNNQ